MEYNVNEIRKIYLNIINNLENLKAIEENSQNLLIEFEEVVELRDKTESKFLFNFSFMFVNFLISVISLISISYFSLTLPLLIFILFVLLFINNIKNLNNAVNSYFEYSEFIDNSIEYAKTLDKEKENVNKLIKKNIKNYNNFKNNYKNFELFKNTVPSMESQIKLTELMNEFDLSNETITNLTTDNYLLDDSFHINTEVSEYNEEISSYQRLKK